MTAALREAEATIPPSAGQELLRALDAFEDRALMVAARVRTYAPLEVGMLEDMERQAIRILDVISPAIRIAVAAHARAEAAL